MNNLIAPSKPLGYSKIYLDFLAGSEPAMHFYPATGPADVAEQLDIIDYDREGICAVLAKQNNLFGASQKTFENIEKLKDRRTLCVVSGQQAGLFGGPLLVFIKALSVVKAAELYSGQLNRPVVPVLWIAADDHDFEEVNNTWVLGRDAELVKVSYRTPPELELPAAEIRFTDETALKGAKKLLRETLGETDFTPGLYKLLDRLYTTGDTFVTAFGKLVAALTSDTGLILFSPGDKQAKRMAAGLLKAIVDGQDELHRRLSETNRQIQEHGYHIQVEKKENAAHLFYNCNGRRPVLRDGDEFTVDSRRFTREELHRLIEKQTVLFSPDVMTRPILQSYLFPVVSQKGGAAEIAYLAQINRIFDLFGLVTPFYKARPSVTIVEKRFEKMLREYKIGFDEIAGDIEQLVNRILARSFPQDLEDVFGHLRKHIECHFDDISSATLKFDPALRDFARQTFGKVDFSLKAFEGKVFSSHKKKSWEMRERIYRLWRSVYPNRNFQERSINIFYFLSKYGLDFMSFLYDRMDCEEKAHQVIHLSEFDEPWS